MDPVPTVKVWSGREVRALREAKRMSIREFAAHLGISERMVSKWEARAAEIHPRPVNQAALDCSLAASTPAVQARFTGLLNRYAPGAGPGDRGAAPPWRARNQVTHPIDGKLMTVVEASVYLSGLSNEPVFLPDFWMDVCPTTNADYLRFVRATGHRSPKHWSNDSEPSEELLDHPVVFVTWHDAAAYASWTAKSLPTSQQWEKAARGTRGDVYPWGSQLTPAKCNVRKSAAGHTTPVDRYHSGVSSYGIYDMCGNVWEWLSTESQPGRHELKGSAFTSPFRRATPSAFNDAAADMLDDDTGFRCVSPLETLQSLMNMNA
jgi:hypothetical protein